MDEERRARQLRLIGEVVGIADRVGAEVWLRGGWAMDFLLGRVTRDAAGRVVVAGGPWAGEPWPDGVLDGPPGSLGRVRCRIVNARAQTEIKRMMPVRVPGRPHRAKDAEDIARLAEALGQPER